MGAGVRGFSRPGEKILLLICNAAGAVLTSPVEFLNNDDDPGHAKALVVVTFYIMNPLNSILDCLNNI